MTATATDPVAAVEERLGVVEALPDPAARAAAMDAVRAVLDLYGEGLARFVEHVSARDADGSLAAAVAADPVVSHLLLVHGLHPVPVEARVAAALEEVRPFLGSHGGGVELLGVRDGIAHVRLEGTCHGCPASTATLRSAIEAAVLKAAPDVEAVEAQGAVAPPAGGLLQIELAVPPGGCASVPGAAAP